MRTVEERLELRQKLSDQYRVDCIRATTAAASGHVTSALSAADLVAVLVADYLSVDLAELNNPLNDHLLFSKGHAAPLFYAVLKSLALISDEELLSLRNEGSRLQGHPIPPIPLVDVATGSLGQGLGFGVGIALAGRYLEKRNYRTWVLLGDGEMAEGSVWEALACASHYKLDNLTAIVDVNRLGQTGPTALEWDTETYSRRIAAFGWEVLMVDGHDHTEIGQAYQSACENKDRPTLILARTVKGKGVKELEDRVDYHGKSMSRQQADVAVAALGGERVLQVLPRTPGRDINLIPKPTQLGEALRFEEELVATRTAYGETLRALGAEEPLLVVVDAEVSDSTRSSQFMRHYPERSFEMFIAEQQMVATAVGLQTRGFKVFLSTFAAFLSRAYDFLRIAAISNAELKVVGSHAGVSIGPDGPSQMGLEDIAALSALWNTTILYPCDAYQTAELVKLMVQCEGITYLRTTREPTPIIYSATERFRIGGSKVLRSSPHDQVTLLAAGITVFEALQAAELLSVDGIAARVVDLYSIKPIDRTVVFEAAEATSGNLVVVEDHRPEGGIGSAVALAFSGYPEPSSYNGPAVKLVHLAVRGVPPSASPDAQLRLAGIDREAIRQAALRSLRIRAV